MAEHFKLEITNRSTKITTFTGVSNNFAEEYRETLSGNGGSENDDKPISDGMIPVLENVGKMPPKDGEIKKDATKNETVGKYSKYNYAKRVKQRRSKFKTLAYINFMIPNIQFITLTFDNRIFENADDLDNCHKAFQRFIKRIRHQYSDFLYLAVFSRQKNKNWHYHMLCNFDETVTGKIIHDLWTYGIIHNTVIYNNDEFQTKISYCVDNMEQVSWDELQGEKGYLNSKGLQNKIVLRSWNDDERDAAWKYLSEILSGNDKPLPVESFDMTKEMSEYELKRYIENKAMMSEEDEVMGDASGAPQINYLFSQKGFTDLFQKPVVASRLKLE